MDDKFWYLKNCDLFDRLAPAEVALLETQSRSRTFDRKSLIYMPSDQGDAVLLLVSGRVKIYHLTGEGKESLLAFIEPGELFGDLAVIDAGQREEFAETMEKSAVVLIPGDAIRRLMEDHPAVSLGISKLMGLRRRRVERRLKSLLFRSNRQRLVYLLLELAERYGKHGSDGVTIGLKLSHQELSSIIGSTRETVTVLLGELQDEGSLIIKRRQIVLKDLQALASTVDELVPSLPAGEQKNEQSLRPARL